ncbi:MAG: DNA methyltransferase [Pseudomonadota bacterium]
MSNFSRTVLGNASLYFMDCMEYMKSISDNHYDVAIVDPEWGRKEHGGINRSKFVKQNNGSKMFVDGNKYKLKCWDEVAVGREYFKELFRISKNQIIFGVNYFEQNFGSGRIVWDKCNSGSDQSDCEIAYNSMTSRVDLFRYMWRGMLQGSGVYNGHVQQGNKKLNEVRIHPCQKPVALYDYILTNFIEKGMIIFDSHHGSGSLSVSCNKLGYKIDACENDQDYFEDSLVRIGDVLRQADFMSDVGIVEESGYSQLNLEI